ncbi:MAG: VTT domain-containing protein [Candidatus Vogelbacteria bacterium]|nr:VTT domain-containing protein [Candidatus Vogelbacteria bacterium]
MDIFSSENLIKLIEAIGYLGLFLVIFAESGLFIGFFLPGDSLIFTACFLASQNLLNIWWLIPLLFVGAVLGDNFGYAFGKKVGPAIFRREDGLLFKKKNLLLTKNYFEKYGAKTLILARFMPIVRTFAPILAGVGEMEYKKFFSYNLVGGALWTLILPLLGYFLGRTIPNVDQYLLPIVLAIIVLSFLPSVYELLRTKN